jgi:hypothetical protein
MSRNKIEIRELTELANRKGAQLTAFLSHVSPEIALQLATALERDRLAGGSGLPFEAILSGLRPRLRQLAPEARRRIPTPQRLFFEVIEGMITDSLGEKTAGRIARRSLEPIWRWLQTCEKERLDPLREKIAQQVLNGDQAAALQTQKQFDAIVGEAIRAAVKKVEQGAKAGKDLVQAVGGQRAFEDMRELGRVLQISDEIRELKSALPPVLDAEVPEQLDMIRAAFERSVEKSLSGAPYLVLSLSPRVIHPWELLGIAAKLVRAEHDQQLKASELGMVGEWLVNGLEAEAAGLKALKPADFDPAKADEILRRFALLQAGMTREVGMRKDGTWGKRLLKTRGLVSDAMQGLLERIVKDLQLALPMERASSGSRSGALVPTFKDFPDRQVDARLPAMAKFLATAKQFAGQLGFSVAFEKTHVEIQSLFDDYTDGLLNRLSQARGAERDLAQAWADLTVRIMAPVFSEEAMRILGRRLATASADLQERA